MWKGRSHYPRCVVSFRPEMYLWSILYNNDRTKKGSDSMSKGSFCYARCVVCFQLEMHIWNTFWNNDDAKKAPIQCRRDGFVTLDRLYLFDQMCTSGIYFGIVTTPRRLQFKVEGKVSIPSMCSMLLTRDVPLKYNMEEWRLQEGPNWMSKGRFRYPRCVVYFRPETYLLGYTLD